MDVRFVETVGRASVDDGGTSDSLDQGIWASFQDRTLRGKIHY